MRCTLSYLASTEALCKKLSDPTRANDKIRIFQAHYNNYKFAENKHEAVVSKREREIRRPLLAMGTKEA